MNLLLAPLISFGICFILLRWLLRGRFAQAAMDLPNHRSLHSTPTPRIGGVGLVAGILCGGAMAGTPALLLVLLAMLGWLGLLDDRRGLSVAIRLPIQLFASIAWILGAAQGDLLSGSSFAVTWYVSMGLAVGLCWMMNLYNFMDGSNGLAGGMAFFGFGAYGAAAALAGQTELAVLALVVAGAATAFLLFNFDPARVFLGDSGSISLGFLAGTLGILGWMTKAWPFWFPLLVFSVFIVDATVTLLRRALRGEKVWIAHREHFYQRLISTGWSHRRVALSAYALMVTTACSALLLIKAPAAVQAGGVVAWVVTFAVLMRLVDRLAPRIAETL